MKNKNKLVARQWLEKADKDLEVAEILFKKGKRFTDFSCFHCQQAFEKYLKALAANNGLVPDRTHDLEKLLNKVIRYDFSLVKLIDLAKEMSPFAVLPRYPDEVFTI